MHFAHVASYDNTDLPNYFSRKNRENGLMDILTDSVTVSKFRRTKNKKYKKNRH